MIPKSLKSAAAAVTLLMLGAILGVGTVATLNASDGDTVHACVKGNGHIRIVDAA